MLQIEQRGVSIDNIASYEAVDQGHVVMIDATTGKWKKATVGQGQGISKQVHQVLSSGTDVYSSAFDGRRNEYRPSLDNVGQPLGVEGGTFVASNFTKFTGTVTAGDLLYCVGSGFLAAYATASGADGWSATPMIAVARAITGGTRTNGSGTATIRIEGVFAPTAAA